MPKPTGQQLRDDGAIPWASQIRNDSDADGAAVSDVLTALDTLGALTYQGVWDADANSPAITGGAGTKGFYYLVSKAGTTSIDGINDWQVDDWIIYNGSAWEKIDHSSLVATVFGRTGAVVAAASDYDASQVDNDSVIAGAFVDDALNVLNSAIKQAKVASVAIDTLNDEQSVALGGKSTDEFCPSLAVVQVVDVGAGAGAAGDLAISIGITSGGTEILAAKVCTGLIALNTKFIIDLSEIVKPAMPANSTVYVKVTTCDTTAGAGHLADVYLFGQTILSAT